MTHAFSPERELPLLLKALFGDHSSGGLLFVETVIDDSFGVSFDLRVEPALKTCYCFILKEMKGPKFTDQIFGCCCSTSVIPIEEAPSLQII